MIVAAAVLAAVTGCSRQHFRERTDKDVEGVLSQKNVFPDWQIENWHVYPDPRARFADAPGSHPDFPPYPPDDYAAWVSSPNPQHPGRGGAGRYEGTGYLDCLAAWDAQNRAEDAAEELKEKQEQQKTPAPGSVIKPEAAKTGADTTDAAPKDPTKTESPAPEQMGAVVGGMANFLTIYKSEDRPYRLRLEQAVELALFNSREFQDRREDLYLAALPVTLERYSFAAQAFATERIIRESIGRDYPGGGGEFWRINTDVGFTRNFATGAELVVRLANQIVIDLSGPSPQTSISNLGLTFIQPLLRGGGYAVTLEALTQSERTLLYAIRSFARFRKVFYVAIAGVASAGGGGGGADYTNNPYGLQGLSTNLGRGIGANLTARATGFLPTILISASLANERKNMAALENFLLMFQYLKEGGGVTELQVADVELDLLNSRNTVLSLERNYLRNVDFFKLQLGIPATVALELDDTPLRPMRRHLQRFEEVYAELRDLEQAIGRYNPDVQPGQVRERAIKLLTESSLARGTSFPQQYKKIAEEFRQLSDEALAQQLAQQLADRRKLLDARAERQLQGVVESPAQATAITDIENRIDLLRFEQALREYEAQPWRRSLPERRAAERERLHAAVAQAGFLVAARIRNQRLERLRQDWPTLLQPVVEGSNVLDMPYDEAIAKVAQAALTNRLDLMNARAQVVDAWRQVTVDANALQGTFDVRYDLDTTTPRDQAATFGFAGTRTRHTVTVDIEPPFVRRAERNQYRASLISYERSRRNLMAFEDNIITDARVTLRELRLLAGSYALQQRVVELAYAQVDNARSTLLAPPDPTSARGAAGEAAALTQQLLNAQRALLRAQNDLYQTWISYHSIRMNFYLDLELLPLDARGIWIDEPNPLPADGPAEPVPAPGPAEPRVGERLPDPRPLAEPQPR